PAAHRRPDQERRGRLHHQHHRRAPGDQRLVLDPPRGAAAAGDLFDDRGRRTGAGAVAGLPRRRAGLVAAGTARPALLNGGALAIPATAGTIVVAARKPGGAPGGAPFFLVETGPIRCSHRSPTRAPSACARSWKSSSRSSGRKSSPRSPRRASTAT